VPDVTPVATTTSRALAFEVAARCPETRARAGVLHLAHGTVHTPLFMPVGTQGAVKAVPPRVLEELGAGIVLANTYHLYLRPGHSLVESLGGLNRFMGWDRPLLTDSGGYQVFSLGELCQVTDAGVRFSSHVDGSRHDFTPELSMEVQQALGADIAMVFDECLTYPATREATRVSMERSVTWAARSKAAHTLASQALFGIVQGGFEPDLRVRSAHAMTHLGFDGYALGGLSVGEGKGLMLEVLDTVVPHLPEDAPRYLMGVGLPIDLVEAVARGIDMFDCVMPTRHARTGSLFCGWGRINIKNARHRDEAGPVEPGCACYTCKTFSRAYLRHLFMAGELLGFELNAIHNLHHYLSLMARMREAIAEGRFGAFHRDAARRYHEEMTHA
jgi:queuine tRNA-ribosyltransferase